MFFKTLKKNLNNNNNNNKNYYFNYFHWDLIYMNIKIHSPHVPHVPRMKSEWGIRVKFTWKPNIDKILTFF